jgi:hypothetical protein
MAIELEDGSVDRIRRMVRRDLDEPLGTHRLGYGQCKARPIGEEGLRRLEWQKQRAEMAACLAVSLASADAGWWAARSDGCGFRQRQ